MNYYEHHIGDYAAATSHLSLLEDAVYSRLIRRYYLQEGPMPADWKQTARLVGARTQDELDAVEAVLGEFFTLEGDGYHQKRCDEVLAAFIAGEPERNAKKSNEDARLARHREERSNLFAELNALGQHAAWNIGMNELRMLVERYRNAPATQPATAPATPATATQSPIPSNHIPEKKEQKQKLAPSAKPTTPTESPAVVFLTLNDGSEFPIVEEQVREFSDLYPAVDIQQSLRAMRGWCVTNPTNRKTRAGIMRFVNRWLAKEQDSGANRGQSHAISTQRGNLSAGERVEQKIADRRNRESRIECLEGQTFANDAR